MTPAELELRCRNRYNAVGDTFWSQAEIFGLITDACTEAALEAQVIERTYTTTTVAGTQEYSFPTNVIAIKRVTYDGIRLDPIDMIEDDAFTGMRQNNVDQGTPEFYWQWNYSVSLRKIPDDAKTLKIWAYAMPSEVTASSVLEVPAEFHHDIETYVLKEMAFKDKNYRVAEAYEAKWERAKVKMRSAVKKRKRADGFAVVKSEEILPRGL